VYEKLRAELEQADTRVPVAAYPSMIRDELEDV